MVPAQTSARRRILRAQAGRDLPLQRAGGSGGDRRICRAGDSRTDLSEKKPVFGICLGHQMLAIAIGGRTMKMHQGHHGANHPVKDLTTGGKVEITLHESRLCTVDGASLPANAVETHVSLFDGSNCGLALKDRPVFSVQYHPEASPGPRDSHGLFRRFVEQMRAAKQG